MDQSNCNCSKFNVFLVSISHTRCHFLLLIIAFFNCRFSHNCRNFLHFLIIAPFLFLSRNVPQPVGSKYLPTLKKKSKEACLHSSQSYLLKFLLGNQENVTSRETNLGSWSTQLMFSKLKYMYKNIYTCIKYKWISFHNIHSRHTSLPSVEITLRHRKDQYRTHLSSSVGGISHKKQWVLFSSSLKVRPAKCIEVG